MGRVGGRHLVQGGGSEAVAGEDGLGFGGVEVGEEALGQLGVWGVAENGGGVAGGDLGPGAGYR